MKMRTGSGRIAISATVAVGLIAGIFAMWWPAPGSDEQSHKPTAIDIGFSQAMIEHHDQAVLMSQILLQGDRSDLSGIALSIQTTQLLQMGQMRGWLQLWRSPLLPTDSPMQWMLRSPAASEPRLLEYLSRCRAEGGMPGMASSEQLQQLRGARGGERDRLYLQMMLRHHSGALPMAQFAAEYATAPVVRALAGQIAFDQAGEIQRLQQLSSAREN
jgi:uncharacterized protein (DUF305 family)